MSLDDLYAAALPADAPGAWIRDALDQLAVSPGSISDRREAVALDARSPSELIVD